MARPSNIEPTATDQRLWNRKAAERINLLLAKIEELEKRIAALEAP
jgi:hypothetical protein